jgi:hypothetical protein
MRPLIDMDTIQIEITNHCVRDCSNCTRFCGHIMKPYNMDMATFKTAIDSMAGYPKMVGIMGGEPLLHPQFTEICEYAASVIPRKQLGLWTALPAKFEKYAEVICKTFGNIFINDHSRDDIYHAPILIGIEDAMPNKDYMWAQIDHCWVQNTWSASINPNGVYFCEVAAAMSLLFQEKEYSWMVEPKWWLRTPKDFRAQMEKFCPRCGLSLPLKRRVSTDGRDDISPRNAKALLGKSRKLDKCIISTGEIVQQPEPMASYKDISYRQAIAGRYGMHLIATPNGFCEPVMGLLRESIYSKLQKQFGGLGVNTCHEQSAQPSPA